MSRPLIPAAVFCIALFAGSAAAREAAGSAAIDAATFPDVDPTGVADSTAGLQAAVDAASRARRPLHLCGRYKISAPLRFHSDDGEAGAGSGIVGCSETGATLTLTDPTQDGILVEAPAGRLYQSCVVRDLTIEAALDLKTGGAGIHLVNTERCDVEQNRLVGMFVGLRLSSTALSYVAHNAVTQTSRQGVAVSLEGTDVNSYVVQNYADNAATHEPAVGLRLTDQVNGTYVADNSFSHFDRGVEVAPTPGGKVQNLFFRQNAWDGSGRAGALFDASRAPIYRIFVVNDWYAATSLGPGLRFVGREGMSNFQLVAPQVRDNWTNGIEIAGRVRQMVLDAAVITANNVQASAQNPLRSGKEDGSGILIAPGADVADLQLHGGIIGPTAEEWKAQSAGITIAAGAAVSRSTIVGVDVAGNTKNAIVGMPAGAGNRVEGNVGYNPVGPRVIAVGASPFTYVAGPSPETLYISGGTCTAVAQGSIVLFKDCAAPATLALGPNERVTVTYSAAPAIRTMVH